MNRKKKQIINAAHRLFIEKGFVATSIQDILDEAEIAKGTFYNYFTSKNECLMAILEFVYEETNQKRNEIAHGKNINDEKVLAEQIAIRMDTNRKHSMMALFSSISLLDDEDLQAFIGKQHRRELQWVAKRLKEVNGADTERFALDHAVILLGTIHHAVHLLKINENKEITPRKVIQFAIDSIKPIVKGHSQEVLFHADMISNVPEDIGENIMSLKIQTISQLETLLKEVNKREGNHTKKGEYLQFLIGELEMEKPRLFLVESVLMSLSKIVDEREVIGNERQVFKLLWTFIEKIKEAEAEK